MLLEFKVKNFRSIREEQTLSLAASKADKKLNDCLIDASLAGLSGVKFLKGAALYGANASGKSNIMQAMGFLASFVRGSAINIKPGDLTGAEPFKLDKVSATKPTEFEITFVAEGVRFVFGLSLTKERVLEEYLVAYPNGVPQRWYERTYNAKKKGYDWAKPSVSFKDDKSLREKTRENSLFLSVGPQFNHQQLTQVLSWFYNKLRMFSMDAEQMIHPLDTALYMTARVDNSRIVNLLRNADIGIVDASVRQTEIGVDDLRQRLTLGVLAKIESEGGLRPMHTFDIALMHKMKSGDPVAMDYLKEESAGTRRLFSVLGPWLNALDNGHTLFVDEIETSLHPVLVKELLGLFFSKKNNPKNSQIIFTTHSPSLMSSGLMRRDQIWFTEKSDEGATELYPLTEYKPREDEALSKGYLGGRYGAIPHIPEGLAH